MGDKRIFIVSGEASGDMYGALLCRRLKKFWPDIEISGKGGSLMRKEGARLIATASGSHGFTETITVLRTLKKNFVLLVKEIKKSRPHVLVLVDYPEFNIPLSRKIKPLGIPILYYVSPTVWAWRMGRAKKIAKRVQAIALIFPFEVDIYKPLGIHYQFVGHPILDFHKNLVLPGSITQEEARKALEIDSERRTVALMPGSRNTEIKKLLPLLLKASQVLKKKYPHIQFVMPLAPDIEINLRDSKLIKIVKGRVGEVLIASDAGIIASGTATLEACFFNLPIVMIYKLSPLTYFLGRLFIKTKYISHVNLLLNREVVPELIQHRATVFNIVHAVEKIFEESEYRRDMLEGYKKMQEAFGPPGASLKVAKMVGKLAGWSTES